MKILNVVTNGLHREGITTTQIEFVRAMDMHDVQMDFASVLEYDEDVSGELESLGCRVIAFPNRQRSVFQYLLKLWKVLKREQYDIIHVHGSSCLISMELFEAKLAGVRVRIAHARNTRCDHERVHQLLRPVFDRSYTSALACGDEAGRWLFHDKPFTVIHNGKNLDEFSFSQSAREEMRLRLDIGSDKAIGFAGNLKEQKNPEYLMEILRSIYELDRGVRFFIMGSGGKRELMEKKAHEYGIDSVTVFTGAVSNMSQMLQAMDVMLLPSKWEGLPNVVLEWQALAVPCIVSDRVTKECSVTDQVRFLPIDIDPARWAGEALALKAEDREAKSEENRRLLAVAGYDIRARAAQMKQLYYDMLNETA